MNGTIAFQSWRYLLVLLFDISIENQPEYEWASPTGVPMVLLYVL